MEKYFDTLIALLSYIRDNAVTAEDLTSWFSSYASATGQVAISGYISSLARLGLWQQHENVLRLTPEGTSIVADDDSDPAKARETVARLKYDRVAGYDYLFEFLASGDQSTDAIWEYLNQSLSVNWKTRNQASFRISWLRSLGYVEKVGMCFRLTDDGRAMYQILKRDTGPAASPPAVSVANARSTTQPEKEAASIADELERLSMAVGTVRNLKRQLQGRLSSWASILR